MATVLEAPRRTSKAMAAVQAYSDALVYGWVLRDGEGQDISEYVLVAALVASVAVAVIPGLFSFSGDIVQWFRG